MTKHFANWEEKEFMRSIGYTQLSNRYDRMRAILANVPDEFQEKHELEDKTTKKVLKRMISRALSHKEATALLNKLDKKTQWFDQILRLWLT